MSDIPQDAAPNYAPNVVTPEALAAGQPAQTAEAGTAASGETSTGAAAVVASADASSTPAISQPSESMPEAGNAPAVAVESATAPATAEPLPRESHLMLLEHKLAMMHAKFKTGERIVIDEFEQILAHIRAVL